MNLPRKKNQFPRWVQILILLVVLAVLWYQQRGPGPSQPSPDGDGESPTTIVVENDVVRGVVVRDESGDVVYRGNVLLSKTLERIKAEEELEWHPNDGEFFGNFERRLPQKKRGYYREWVHPTPGLRGPGPQRIVTGQAGEIWYTPDHYENFYSIAP